MLHIKIRRDCNTHHGNIMSFAAPLLVKEGEDPVRTAAIIHDNMKPQRQPEMTVRHFCGQYPVGESNRIDNTQNHINVP